MDRNRLLETDKISFALYTSEEIKSIAVVEVTNPNSFDILDSPLTGGLYDPAMGPIGRRGQLCTTCRHTENDCYGHFGYIDLPVPVTNPLMFKTVYEIIRLFCLNCYSILIPEPVKDLLEVQLKLLDAGFVEDCQHFATLTAGVLLDANITVVKLVETISKVEVQNYLQECKLKLESSLGENKGRTGNFHKNKTIESLRNYYIQTFTLPFLSKRCLLCNKATEKLKFVDKTIYITASTKAEQSDDRIILGDNKKTIAMMSHEAREQLRKIWTNNADFLKVLFPAFGTSKALYPTDSLFFDVVPVPPINNRPVTYVGNQKEEHPVSKLLKNIINQCVVLRCVLKILQDGHTDNIPEEGKVLIAQQKGNNAVEKLYHFWTELQELVNRYLDCDPGGPSRFGRQWKHTGIKQVLENKDGLLRMHMMGKRVNYAARSVIAPDPNLNVDEIGVPERFALTLTYPVPVTVWNVDNLRTLVINGPEVHPGAVQVENEEGYVQMVNPYNLTKRETLAKRLLTPANKSKLPQAGFKDRKYVFRHMQNGDIVLANRQPSLHKPSIMAHKVRILKNEKTLRLHYANCKSYNADFDGDEMNIHFPQSELARSEAYNIANVTNQYLVPKDGSPLSGLIQDHIVGSVHLSVRGRFFSREAYQQLVYQSLQKTGEDVKLLPPVIQKPVKLWTGKQVLSTIIINVVPQGKKLLSLSSRSKMGPKAWQTRKPRKWKAGGKPFVNERTMCESEVIIRNGELLSGVLDKSHFGSSRYSLVHCMYELYGGNCASQLLSCAGKLFTSFLQMHGFTMGVEDLVVRSNAEKDRAAIIERLREVGFNAMSSALNFHEPSTQDIEDKLKSILNDTTGKWKTIVDRSYKNILDSFTNDINKVCVPSGLIQKLPNNNLQLIVESGAKGASVNTMQISCLLGQVELEGKRPPLMQSKKALPCFRHFDLSPRAGGFIDGRFLTGINVQELFFQCMAGREGLVDTAVKTSVSGYLQRCLIKHLEGLVVQYDLTVRDSDGSVIQYYYGEDGMDVMKVQFLKPQQLPFLIENKKRSFNKQEKKILSDCKQNKDYVELMTKKEKVTKWIDKFGKMSKTERRLSNVSTPDPVISQFRPDLYFGSLSEHLDGLVTQYFSSNIHGIDRVKEEDFLDLLYLDSMKALCAPGEPVGILAAQSIGEPSTQMTLNTFHFAGRGEMNVTLGIPRLREILMSASKNIATPSMEIPFLPLIKESSKKVTKIRKALQRCMLSDVLEKILVKESITTNEPRKQVINLQLSFLPPSTYKNMYRVSPQDILKCVERHYLKNVMLTVKNMGKLRAKIFDDLMLKANKKSKTPTADKENEVEAEITAEEDENHFSESEDSEIDEEDAKSQRRHVEGDDYGEDSGNENGSVSEDYPATDTNFIKLADGSVGQNDELNSSKQPKKERTEEDKRRIQKVKEMNPYLTDYKYDVNDALWCDLTIELPISFRKVDISNVLKQEAERTVVWGINNIKKGFTYTDSRTGNVVLKTEGINIGAIFKFHKTLDLNKIYTNDIHGIASIYGIEAARRVLIKEVKDVFNVYGIVVDMRHLQLVADYMTFDGTYKPMNRTGLSDSCSPMQQISFESSMNFIKSAALYGKEDYLQAPSSALTIGKICRGGTGLCSILTALN